MDTERIETISPVVDFLRPDLPDAEKQRLTEALRPYFRALYDTYCRMDRDDLLEPDSPESEGGDRLGVSNRPSV